MSNQTNGDSGFSLRPTKLVRSLGKRSGVGGQQVARAVSIGFFVFFVAVLIGIGLVS